MPSAEALEQVPRIGGTTSGTSTATGGGTVPSTDALSGGSTSASQPPPGASAAAKLANLLPMANSTLSTGSGGVYVGDGLPPFPAKLAAKIRRGEFVEMGELLPEFWSAPPPPPPPPRDEDSDSKRDNKVRHSRKVTDIFTWLQCFCSFVGVRAQPNPELVPELMAYMTTIVRVSQDYPGLAWVQYDAAFRRQAALTGDTRWSTINPTLYTVCFTGVAASTARCELCFATSHTERECAQRGDPDPGMKDRLKVLETAILAMSVFSSNTEPQTLQNHKLNPRLN